MSELKMVDMKLPKKSKEEMKKEMMVGPASSEQDRWPYGLQLRFETEEVNKLPVLTTFKVGDKVMVMAEAVVIEMRQSETQSTNKEKQVRYTVELQIQQVACEPKVKKPLEKMSPKEYRKARMSGEY